MDRAFLEQMKEKLLEMKREILMNLAQENEELEELISNENEKDLVDIAANDLDRRILNSLEGHELRRLNQIDAALARIENGKYGYCLKDGKPIPRERLEAIPYALYCLDCQKELERKQRL
ncbi:TraR/DksA family transcriptional regulator [Spirochaeta thermophila]|uniref:C4 zinc finger domain protein, DksA/TraR family n=1 Tax=Winmispira thermophila (strain ATCC 49972 / DSM 6192 / RI 19.B1) TaxID=665571 RepID=E0RNL9_WINT6|nr:TraR/DksA family transcriptional regulator [Spirochaeta thermophila]ADN02610.1 C4 zinc finger domain protein, DksA/TraR family [Spirochaeta thermophila DSM 6192]